MSDLRVYKTLVIGLGSTGTRILEALAERIEWEVGSLDRAPWVQFLAIETDAAMKSRFNGTDDFKTLGISAGVWRDVLERPELFEDSIALSQWSDQETLRQLNAQGVNAGAGHIRMVGRLALLYSDNYRNVKNAIDMRLARLRQLKVSEAKKALNQNAAGLEQEISFAVDESSNQTGLRVIVVGTLVGGTCSGTAADMGILLRTLMMDGELSMGIFSLPHPLYANSKADLAELRKANAYHALVEFNQYHLYTDTERYKGIKYADKPAGQEVLAADATPYDLVYLVRPRDSRPEDEAKLTQAMADRMFLNVFVPDTDPFAATVNGGVTPPNKGRAFAFATFGLSTIEYPVRRIVEACKYRTLTHAVRRWKDRKFEGRLDEELDQLGLSVDHLTDLLLVDEGGASIRTALDSKGNEVMRHARRDVGAARKALDDLRGAFGKEKGEGLRGLAHHTMQDNRRRAADTITGNLHGLVAARLLDYDQGPAALAEVVEAVPNRLGELRGWDPAEGKGSGANGVLDSIEAINRNTLLGLFGLKRKAALRMMPALNKAVNDELKARVNHKAKEILRDSGSGQKSESGSLSLIQEDAARIEKRLINLRRRLDSQSLDWGRAQQELENKESEVNGLSLFESSPNGTVDAEFAQAIDDRGLEALSARIIRSWDALARGVTPGLNDPDWLSQSWVPGQPTFESEQLEALERIAVRPFEDIRHNQGKDIFTRLQEKASPSFDPVRETASAATDARLFLDVTEALAQPDPMTPLPKAKRLIGRAVPSKFKDNLQSWRQQYPLATDTEGSDAYRVVMLEEWYKFALRGSNDVKALAYSKPSNITTLFTRRRGNIDWTPIDDAEVQKLDEAERLIMLGALHGVLRLEQGALVMDWQPGPGESADASARQRRFEPQISKAARRLAFEPTDRRGKSLTNAKAILSAAIQAGYQEFQRGDQAEGNRSYVRWLQQQVMHGDARSIEDWDHRKATSVMIHRATSTPELQRALLQVFKPNQLMLDSIFKPAGTPLTRGLSAKVDGFYCSQCGGLVGQTEEEVIANNLQCQNYPEHPLHPFGREYSLIDEPVTA